ALKNAYSTVPNPSFHAVENSTALHCHSFLNFLHSNINTLLSIPCSTTDSVCCPPLSNRSQSRPPPCYAHLPQRVCQVFTKIS
ncbi:hypothetical protein PMAYCL1PPCAC_05238, partial [Pristionchus mayeri]